MAVQIQIRHGSAAAWTAANPLLAVGEMGVETDTDKFKFGDGVTLWNALPYASGTTALKFSAGTLSAIRSDITFANSNGVSFGLDGAGVVTGTVATNYQSQGAYLTTAMASNRGSDFVQATAAFAGTNASGTINSTGISVSVAAQSAQSLNISAGTTSNNLTAVTFSNSNNVSFGINASTVTASIATTYAGTGFTTATTAGTAVVGTLNTSGLSLGVPAFLTTADLSQNSSKYAGTNFATTTSAGTAIAGTLNTSGLTLGVPPFLTTAMQSNAATISNINISAGTTSTNASAFTFSNSNNFTFGLGTGASAGVVTVSYTVPSVTNSSLTLSDNATSMTIGRLAFTNSNGLTLTLSTTTGGSATLIGSYTVPTVTNSSLTLSDAATSMTIGRLAFTNSNGLTLTLSTTTGGSATLIGSYTVPTVTNSSWTVSDNATSGTVGRLAFTNLNGVTLSLSSGTGGLHTIVGSVATSLTNINVSAGTTSTNASAFTFSNSNQVSFGLGTGASAGVITASIGPVLSYFRNMDFMQTTTSLIVGGSTSHVFPVQIPNYLSISYARFNMSGNTLASTFATTANTAFSASVLSTLFLVAYSLGTGANSLSLQSVASGSVGLSEQFSWTAGAVGSNWSATAKITYPATGATGSFSTTDAETVSNFSLATSLFSSFAFGRFIDIPFATSLTPGPYWFALGISSTTSTQGAANGVNQAVSYVPQGQPQILPAIFGVPGASANPGTLTNWWQLGLGSITSTVINTTASMDLTLISHGASGIMPALQLIRIA